MHRVDKSEFIKYTQSFELTASSDRGAVQTCSKALRMKTAQGKTGQKHIQYSYRPRVQMDYNLEHMLNQLCKMDITISPIISYCLENSLPLYF